MIVLKDNRVRFSTLLLLMISGCAGVNDLDLQNILDNLIKNKNAETAHITGSPLSFQCNGFHQDQPLSLASGKTSDFDDAADLSPDAIFQIGSSSKSFVAVVALQLAASGQFPPKGLDSTLGEILNYPPSSPTWNILWNDIPVRQLLNMTSGIPDYAESDFFLSYFKYPRAYTTDELLQLVADEKSEFMHGTSWKYSNTNYVIVGKLIEHVTKSTLKKQITDRIVNKLGLLHTHYVDNIPNDAISDFTQRSLLMSGYYGTDIPNVISATQDISSYPLSLTNAAGSILSTTKDMIAYIRALFSEKNGLLGSEQLRQLKQLVATENIGLHRAGQPIDVIDRNTQSGLGLGYGLGIMAYFVELPDGTSINVYRHAGDTLAFHSDWIYYPANGAYASYAVNSQGPRGDLLSELDSKIYAKMTEDCFPLVARSRQGTN